MLTRERLCWDEYSIINKQPPPQLDTCRSLNFRSHLQPNGINLIPITFHRESSSALISPWLQFRFYLVKGTKFFQNDLKGFQKCGRLSNSGLSSFKSELVERGLSMIMKSSSGSTFCILDFQKIEMRRSTWTWRDHPELGKKKQRIVRILMFAHLIPFQWKNTVVTEFSRFVRQFSSNKNRVLLPTKPPKMSNYWWFFCEIQ